MQVLAHGAVGVELPEAGGLRAGAAECVDGLPSVELHERCGGRGRAERRGSASGMPVAVMARVDRFTDSQRGLVAEDDGEGEVVASGMLPFGDRKRRGDHGRGGVERGALVNVVELEDVRRHAVRQRSSVSRRAGAWEHRRFVRRTQSPRNVSGHARGQLECAGERGPEPVERCSVCLISDGGRKISVVGRREKFREVACYAAGCRGCRSAWLHRSVEMSP